MKNPPTRRSERHPPTRSWRSSLNPYCIEDLGLTPADLVRDHNDLVTVVIKH